MRSRCMRRRPSHLSPANGTPLNAGFRVRLELTLASAPQSRRGADSTYFAGVNGADAERRLLVRGEQAVNGRPFCFQRVEVPDTDEITARRQIRVRP